MPSLMDFAWIRFGYCFNGSSGLRVPRPPYRPRPCNSHMNLNTYFQPNVLMLGSEDRTCASKCGPSVLSGCGGAALTPAGPNSRPARSTPLLLVGILKSGVRLWGGRSRGWRGFKYYNHCRLHSAIHYVTPADRLNGRDERILNERECKLTTARERRAKKRQDERAAA